MDDRSFGMLLTSGRLFGAGVKTESKTADPADG